MPDKMIWEINGNRYWLKPFPQMTGAFMKKFAAYVNAGKKDEQLQLTVSIEPWELLKDALIAYDGSALPEGLEDAIRIEQKLEMIAELALDYTDFLTGGESYFANLLEKRKAMRNSQKISMAQEEATPQT